ncbi:uncharacterized protein LOC135813171 [Sycon ciliatum]|uniref:uncharacterized protein LOC135813171 n=1 Tax=Sycon ciliatum TaxID=27933 RepID=UPI0031F66ECB
MPDSVRYNIKYLVSNLDVSLILEDLLENDVLSEEEYVTASGKENEKWDHSKYVVRLMLTKTEEQVDTFLNLIQHSQPHVAEHIASTMANRRKATASGKTDRPTKPMSADRESTRDPSSDNPFDLERFVCDIQPWLNTVDADRLRRMVIKKHLITDSASIEGLKRILSRDGISDHNEKLIQLLRAGGLNTYRDLSVVIEELGYVDKSKEMLSILSHTGITMATVGKQKTQPLQHTVGDGQADQQGTSSTCEPIFKQPTSAETTANATRTGTTSNTTLTTTQDSTRSSTSSQSSLPDKDRHFTGRNDIVTEISDNILTAKSKPSSTRVQSLLAPAGFGKTSVAIAVGHVCRNAGCRVEFFDLRGVAGVDAVQAMIHNRLETNPASSETTGKTTKSADGMDDDGSQYDMLCILDNAEDAIQAGADKDFQLQDVVEQLLRRQRNAHVLLTSRVFFDLHAAQFKLQQHRLDGLTTVCAVGLLHGLCVEGSVSIEDAQRLVDHCGNVPLAVRITAGLLQGGRYTPTMLLSIFQDLGLDVFNADGLKPNHRILKLLTIAYNTLQHDDKASFHALSQLRSSFSSDCARVIVGLADTKASMVHLVRFDPLSKICFLDYNPYLDRYSLQPFIAEFGRYQCPEDKQRMYQQRMCKHFLGFVKEVDDCRGCGVDKAVYWSYQLLQEQVNIQMSLSVVDVLSGDDLLPFSGLAKWWGILLVLCGKAAFDEEFGDRIRRLDKAPLSVQSESLFTSVLCCISSPSIADSDVTFESLDSRTQMLLEKSEQEPTGVDSQLQLHLMQLSLESCRVSMSLDIDWKKGQVEPSHETLSRLQVVYQRVTTTLRIGLATGVTECALKLIQLYCSTLLNKDIPNVQVVEVLAERVMSSHFLSQDGVVRSCAYMYDFLLQCIFVILGKGMSSSCSSEWIISPSLITTLGIPRCEWKHVPTAIRRTTNSHDDYTTVSAFRLQLYLHSMDNDTVTTLLDLYLGDLYYNLKISLVLNGRASTTPMGLTLPAQHPYSIVMDYVRRWCNGSNPADHTTALINNCSQNKVPDVEVMQYCILMARALLAIENTTFALAEMSKLFPALKSLVNDLSAYLPSNCATGLSVSGIVYLPPTTVDNPVLYISLIAALHRQSKRSQVSIDHHIALLEWCPRAAACFVCYDLDNITACPHCGMAYLCGKHRQTGEHLSEHNQHCAMLAVLRHCILQAR